MFNSELTNEELKRKIEDRISLTYFPGISNVTNNPPKFHAEVVDNNNQTAMVEHPALSLDPEFVLRPLSKGTHLLCSIRRSKSTLHTTYKMYLEETVTSGENEANKHQSLCPLLMAKRSHGLTFSCPILALNSDDSKQKDSSIMIGKVAKTGGMYILLL